MIDHTGLSVSDFGRSKAFYASALAPLGYQLIMELSAAVTGGTDVAGFGVPPKPDFWIASGQPNVPPVHVAFRVKTRALVDAFHKAAIAAGGRDNGAPAFVLTTTRTTMEHSSWIPTDTTSRRFVTRRREGRTLGAPYLCMAKTGGPF